MGNVAFEVGEVLSLPFEDNTLDAAFENDLFTHLGERAEAATREILRALKPGGVFAARDVDAGAVVWGHPIEPLKMLDELFIAWHKSRGSDITFGKRLPRVLREAGFANIVKSVSADTKGNPGAVRAHADITVSLLDGPFGGDIVEEGWGDRRTVERLKAGIQEWAAHPDAFFANVHVEVVGWKPEPNAQGTS
jgi:SAM-dependent methyltransferase